MKPLDARTIRYLVKEIEKRGGITSFASLMRLKSDMIQLSEERGEDTE